MHVGSREKVYAFVSARIAAGIPPTVREVQASLGFRSVATAREHLDRLVTEGRLLRAEGLARGFRLPAQPQSSRPAVRVPVLGRVQAGDFQSASEDIERYLWLDSRFAAQDLFALRVRGESMTGAGILPDDLVVVRRQPQAENGQVVVALVGDETTVKIFKRRGKRIELHPANPAFKVLVPDPEQLSILGRVVEVRRQLG